VEVAARAAVVEGKMVRGQEFIDTVVARVVLDRDLDVTLFEGGVVYEDLAMGEVSRRLYRNPAEGYAPRVTYWPGSRTLKIEWSVEKMGLERVDVWLRETFGEVPGIRTWRVMRVDYAVNLDVGANLPEYLAAVGRLQLGSWERHPWEGRGVVWKSKSQRGRWVKFYDKGRERAERGGARGESEPVAGRRQGSAHPADGVLRFEVSNYADAVKYMAARWFGCERTVGELVEPGRALYVLAYFWQKLGVGRGVGERDAELAQLRRAFGVRNVAAARHALECYRQHGIESYKSLQLISKSSYYRWTRELREKGFLVSANERASLPALHLPLESVFEKARRPKKGENGENLKNPEPGADRLLSRKTHPKNEGMREKNWAKIAGLLGLTGVAPMNLYLLERWHAWSETASAN